MASTAEIAQRWVDALNGRADPDFAQVFPEHVELWHCYQPEAMDFDGALLGSMMPTDEARFKQLMSDYRVENEELFISENGFALTRTILGTLSGGEAINFPCCTVVTVDDGKIVKIHAYLDHEQHLPLQRAIMEQMAADQAQPS